MLPFHLLSIWLNHLSCLELCFLAWQGRVTAAGSSSPTTSQPSTVSPRQWLAALPRSHVTSLLIWHLLFSRHIFFPFSYWAIQLTFKTSLWQELPLWSLPPPELQASRSNTCTAEIILPPFALHASLKLILQTSGNLFFFQKILNCVTSLNYKLLLKKNQNIFANRTKGFKILSMTSTAMVKF